MVAEATPNLPNIKSQVATQLERDLDPRGRPTRTSGGLRESKNILEKCFGPGHRKTPGPAMLGSEGFSQYLFRDSAKLGSWTRFLWCRVRGGEKKMLLQKGKTTQHGTNRFGATCWRLRHDLEFPSFNNTDKKDSSGDKWRPAGCKERLYSQIRRTVKRFFQGHD